MNLLWQELQFPYSRRNPSQSLGKSAVRIIYCCRTIKWLLADKSRCVQCVQQRLGPKAFTNGENVAFCAKFDSTASILHKLLSQKNTRKSRQPLPRDPWLVRSPELYNKKLINVQLWFYYRPPFLLCPLYQKLESCCLVTSNTEEQLSIIIFSIYFAELMLRRDIACIATSWLGQNFVTLGTHLQHHDLFASKQVTSNLVQVAILSLIQTIFRFLSFILDPREFDENEECSSMKSSIRSVWNAISPWFLVVHFPWNISSYPIKLLHKT